MRLRLGLVCLLPLLVAGCGAADEAVVEQLRSQTKQRCMDDIAPRATSIPGLNMDRFCNCVADKAIAGRSADELRQQWQNSTAEQGRQAGAECLAKEVPAGVSTASAAASGAARR